MYARMGVKEYEELSICQINHRFLHRTISHPHIKLLPPPPQPVESRWPRICDLARWTKSSGKNTC